MKYLVNGDLELVAFAIATLVYARTNDMGGIFICTHTYIYAYIYMHTYIHIHIYSWARRLLSDADTNDATAYERRVPGLFGVCVLLLAHRRRRSYAGRRARDNDIFRDCCVEPSGQGAFCRCRKTCSCCKKRHTRTQVSTSTFAPSIIVALIAQY